MREIIFKELELVNFKVHEEMAFSFVPNRFVTIVGNNGAGKTTMFSALSWALYDQTIEGMSGDDVVRKRSGKDTMVRVTWDDGDDHYEVRAYRKHFQHHNNRYLFKNGDDKPISGTSQKETLTKIENLLMPKDVFFNCLLFSQFVKNHFLDLTAGGRNEILDAMLLLQRFTTWFKKAGDLITKNSANIEECQRVLRVLQAQIETNRATLDEENKHIQVFKKNALETKQQREEEKISYEKILEEVTPKCEGIESLREQLTDSERKKATLESKIQSQREICMAELRQSEGQKQTEIAELTTQLQKELADSTKVLTDQEKELQKKRSYIELEKSEMIRSLEDSANKARERDRTSREAELKPVRDQLQELQTSKRLSTGEIAALKKTVEVNEKKLQEYQKYLGQEVPKCAICKQDLDQKSRHELEVEVNSISEAVSAAQEKIKELNDKKDDTDSRCESLESQIAEITAKWDDSDTLLESKIGTKKNSTNIAFDQKLNDVDVEIEKVRMGIHRVEERLQEKKDELLRDLAKKFLDLSEEIKDKNKTIALVWANEILTITEEIRILTQDVRAKESFVTSRDVALNQLDHIRKVSLSDAAMLDDWQITSGERVRRLEETIERDSESMVNNINQIAAMNRRAVILNFWRTGYSDTGIKAILLDDSIPVLNEKARELCDLAPTLKVRFDSQTALKSGDYRNKFGIEVLQTQNLSGLKELSSGEKRMTDIIVLLCLRHLLEERQNTKMNILLLDEILDSLDPENAALAVTMVKRLSEDHCVALISHTLRDYIESDETYNLSC